MKEWDLDSDVNQIETFQNQFNSKLPTITDL